MAIPGLSTVSQETPTEETQTSSGSAGVPQVVTKGPSGVNYLAPKNTLITDPSSQASILENMQKFIDEREKQKNSLLSALNYASLYGSGGAEGPWRALQGAEEQGNKAAAEIFNMRQAIAQQKSAQAMQQDFMKSNIQQGWLGMPTQPTEGGGGGVQAGGGANFIPVRVAQQFFDLAKTEGIPAANKFKSQYITKQEELETQFLNNPESYKRTIGILNEKGDYEEINAIEARNRIKAGTAKLAPPDVAPAAATTKTTGAVPSLEAIQTAITSKEWAGDKNKAPTSEAGAVGPAQITPETWDTYVAKGVIPKTFKIDNPDNNLEAGKLIIADLYKKHNGQPDKIAAEYYGGPGAIDKDGNIKRDITPKTGIRGPSVGGYIDDIANRLGTTPKEPKPDQNFAQKRQTYEVEKTYQEQLGKEDIAALKDFKSETNRLVVEKALRQNEDLMKIVSTNPTVVGTFADPGITNAVLSFLQGKRDMSREDLEGVIFKASANSTADMRDRQLAAKYLAEMAIRSRQLLKGSGQISDYEQKVLDRMTGSISDPAELLYKTAQIVRARDKYLLEAGKLHKSQEWKRFSDFEKDSRLEKLQDAYRDEIDSIYASEPDFTAKRIKRKTEVNSQEKRVQDIINKLNKPKD